MAVTDLTNTVWEINSDNLPDSDAFFAYKVDVRVFGTQDAYGSYLKWVNAGDMDTLGLWISSDSGNDGSGTQLFMPVFGLINFNQIEFGSEGTDLTNPNLIKWLETHFVLISGGEEPTDIKPVYLRKNGAWVKQNAYERQNGQWVQVSYAESGGDLPATISFTVGEYERILAEGAEKQNNI